MLLCLATPPYNILGSSGNVPKKDAFPWSLVLSDICFFITQQLIVSAVLVQAQNGNFTE